MADEADTQSGAREAWEKKVKNWEYLQYPDDYDENNPSLDFDIVDLKAEFIEGFEAGQKANLKEILEHGDRRFEEGQEVERERIRNKLESKMLEVMESVHDKYTMEQVCDILDEVKKEIEGDEEHAEKENNKIGECKHRYADWCHNPKFDEQEKCPFADLKQFVCRDFEEKGDGEKV